MEVQTKFVLTNFMCLGAIAYLWNVKNAKKALK